MSKIALQDLIKTLCYDVLVNRSCIEINFCIEDDKSYEDCWMGKMRDPEDANKETYWYGLVRDGSQAYDFTKLEDFLNAKVFYGKCICDIIEKIDFYEIDGCSIADRLPYYLNENI